MSYFSDLIAQGRCPSCAGTGRVWASVPAPGERACSTCCGDGFWPPMEARLIETVEDYDRVAAIEDDAG